MNYLEIGKEIIKNIQNQVRLESDDYCESEFSDHPIPNFVFTIGALDRGPRVDHGGGDDGDDWLEDYQVDELLEEYKKSNQNKIDKITSLIQSKLEGFFLRNEFEYGEKGHLTMYVYAKLK